MTISRIGGLVSGMDTEGMVKKLMDAERIPLNRLQGQKQLTQWKRDDYRSMNAQLLNLRSAASDLKMQSSFQGQSADAIVAKVKKFVDTYNDVIAKVNQKVGEEKFKDYPPLTDAQKAGMSDMQIASWEAKAKSGTLHGDRILTGALADMRKDLYTPVSSVTDPNFKLLDQVGISVKGSWDEHGKLTLDETKLRSAITNNPTAVMDVFTVNPTGATHGQQGVAVRLYNSVAKAMKQVADIAGADGASVNDVLDKKMRVIDTQMNAMQRRLNDRENYYWRQFGAMEKALGQSNQQMAWLSQFATH